MQGYSSVAIQVALALGDGIIRRQLGRQRSLYEPQVDLEEDKPYWYKRLKHIHKGAKNSTFKEFSLRGDDGATGSSQVIQIAGAVPGKTVLPKTPYAVVPWGRALPLACGPQRCPIQDRGVQVPVSAAVGAKAPTHLLSLSRRTFCL